MQSLAVDLLLLRSLGDAGLRIAPGRALMARVVQVDGAGRGTLSLAGAVLEATLPKGVHAGQELRLVVREVSADRVLLAVQSDQAAVAPPPVAVALPGGGTLHVGERDTPAPGGSAPELHTLTLRYDAPALGAVDLHFRLDAATLEVGVTVGQGEPVTTAEAAAESLRGALGDAVERAVTVTVKGRREPLEIYA
jgi:hypothetical protein